MIIPRLLCWILLLWAGYEVFSGGKLEVIVWLMGCAIIERIIMIEIKMNDK